MSKHWDRVSALANANGDSGVLDTWQPGRLADATPHPELGPVPAATTRLRLDYNISAFAGTTPGVQFVVESHWGDGQWRTIWQSAIITATGAGSKTVGPGYDNTWPGPASRVRWVLSGTGGPSCTFAASLSPG